MSTSILLALQVAAWGGPSFESKHGRAGVKTVVNDQLEVPATDGGTSGGGDDQGRAVAGEDSGTAIVEAGAQAAPMYIIDVFRGAPGADDACVDEVSVPMGSSPRVAGTGGVDRSIQAHIAATGGAPGACTTPATPADPDAPAPPPVPAGPTDVELLLAAEQYVETLVPPPGLSTEPPNGEGFVGVPVLVQFDREPSFAAPARTVTLFGTAYTLTADLAADTTIDWGDGDIETGIATVGATYDQVHGDLDDDRLIRHLYIHDGDVTITATDTWTVTLTLQGVGTNTVTGITLTDSATIDIIEMQSVVTQ